MGIIEKFTELLYTSYRFQVLIVTLYIALNECPVNRLELLKNIIQPNECTINYIDFKHLL